VLVFTVGADGTAVTALGLWKKTVLWRLNTPYSHVARRMFETTQLILLSYVELGVIATCTNMPTLTGWWRTLGARQRRAHGSSSGYHGRREPSHSGAAAVAAASSSRSSR
jgi:hypothetical protein